MNRNTQLKTMRKRIILYLNPTQKIRQIHSTKQTTHEACNAISSTEHGWK